MNDLIERLRLGDGTSADHELLLEAADALEALAQSEQEPVAYDKTEMNCFVQDLYDKKMQEGKHGHYETMFHVVHQAIKKEREACAKLCDLAMLQNQEAINELEDIDINITWNENSMRDFGKDELNFARAILRKTQEK